MPLPPVTKAPPDCSPPRERPALKMPRRKSAPAGKPPAKPEPWMFPPPHAWSHEYKPASDGVLRGIDKQHSSDGSRPSLVCSRFHGAFAASCRLAVWLRSQHALQCCTAALQLPACQRQSGARSSAPPQRRGSPQRISHLPAQTPQQQQQPRRARTLRQQRRCAATAAPGSRRQRRQHSWTPAAGVALPGCITFPMLALGYSVHILCTCCRPLLSQNVVHRTPDGRPRDVEREHVCQLLAPASEIPATHWCDKQCSCSLVQGSTKPASPAVSPAEKPAAAAAAAAAATFPADPGLLAEELAGPVARSQEADSLAPGDAVEVRSLAVGMRGAWLSATVLQVRSLQESHYRLFDAVARSRRLASLTPDCNALQCIQEPLHPTLLCSIVHTRFCTTTFHKCRWRPAAPPRAAGPSWWSTGTGCAASRRRLQREQTMQRPTALRHSPLQPRPKATPH